jgi:hypothetical protein
MKKKYRVKILFDEQSHIGRYSKFYVIQKWSGFWRWITISEPTIDRERAEKDCVEAQELYDKYNEE